MAGGMTGGPPRVKKTAKRTGMPRCFSSRNVAGEVVMFGAAQGDERVHCCRMTGTCGWCKRLLTICMLVAFCCPRQRQFNKQTSVIFTCCLFAGLSSLAAITGHRRLPSLYVCWL
jgi:hypothetical protein